MAIGVTVTVTIGVAVCDAVGMTVRMAIGNTVREAVVQASLHVPIANRLIDSLELTLRLLFDLLFDRLLVGRRLARVGRIDIRFDAIPASRVILQDALVRGESVVQLLRSVLVHELARSQRRRDGKAQRSIARLQNCGGTLVQDGLVKLLVIDREARAAEEAQQTRVLILRQETELHGQGGRVGHVDTNRVAVAQWRLGDELMEGRPAILPSILFHCAEVEVVLRVSVGNHSVEHLPLS